MIHAGVRNRWERRLEFLERPPWRTLLLLIAVTGAIGGAYLLWTPGKRVTDGRHDLQTNGIWLQHGWLGDDGWFSRNDRDRSLFRDSTQIKTLTERLADHGIIYVFPHLCPSDPRGAIARVDPDQTERFLDDCSGIHVLPWVGGVLDLHCIPDSPAWRAAFVTSIADLLQAHPRLMGVHVNIEPMPSGNPHFLLLLDELSKAIPSEKILSVAAYPPPTVWHRFPEVHWDEPYFREVAKRADQMVPMMYDTGISNPKIYQQLMSNWTADVLAWSGDTQVLLGIPAYDDTGVGYHDPEVENLQNALLGVHAFLSKQTDLPRNYAGVSIYSEWEMDEMEWREFQWEFLRD